MSSDTHVAWALADSMAGSFTVDEKRSVYVTLGAGETLAAIRHMLEIAVRNAQPLPAALVDKMARWLDAHIGSHDEPPLRRLLAGVRRPPGVAAERRGGGGGLVC